MENYNLEEEFIRVQELCYIAREEYGSRATYFDDGMSLEEMSEWEKSHRIKIPDSYKAWLRLVKQCMLLFDLAVLTVPAVNHDIVPDEDLVIVGRLIGDGEYLCFSKLTHEFIRYRDGVQRIYIDFKEFLWETLIRLLEASLVGDDDLEDKDNLLLQLDSKSILVKTRAFNSLKVEERRRYLDILRAAMPKKYDDYIDDIRRQAILDYWQHERELIGMGHCTREWNPDQIEHILNISMETGMYVKQAGRP